MFFRSIVNNTFQMSHRPSQLVQWLIHNFILFFKLNIKMIHSPTWRHIVPTILDRDVIILLTIEKLPHCTFASHTARSTFQIRFHSVDNVKTYSNYFTISTENSTKNYHNTIQIRGQESEIWTVDFGFCLGSLIASWWFKGCH